MAHFYASIQGSRGEATRMGTKASGMKGHIRGWHVGGEVCCENNAVDNDQVDIALTGGSHGRRSYGFFRAVFVGGEQGVVITRLQGDLLHRMTDEAWEKLFADEGVAKLLKRQLLLHLDKANAP